MPKWGKYSRTYQSQWEKLDIFKGELRLLLCCYCLSDRCKAICSGALTCGVVDSNVLILFTKDGLKKIRTVKMIRREGKPVANCVTTLLSVHIRRTWRNML